MDNPSLGIIQRLEHNKMQPLVLKIHLDGTRADKRETHHPLIEVEEAQHTLVATFTLRPIRFQQVRRVRYLNVDVHAVHEVRLLNGHRRQVHLSGQLHDLQLLHGLGCILDPLLRGLLVPAHFFTSCAPSPLRTAILPIPLHSTSQRHGSSSFSAAGKCP